MDVKKEIAAALAHEIKNPISVIKANIDYIKSYSDDEMLPAFNVIDKELSKLNELVSNYTTILRPSEEYEKIYLEDIIYDVTDEFAITSEVEFLFDIEADISIYGDYSKISIMLFNMYKNAIEAEADTIKTNLYRANGNAVIEIEDNGKGMSKTEAENIGSPFFTTKEKGSGLGVLICRTIAENMGGRFEIRNNSKGCVARVDMPVASKFSE